jgi:hypothetical protein
VNYLSQLFHSNPMGGAMIAVLILIALAAVTFGSNQKRG